MKPPVIEPARAAALAERVLNALNSAKEVMSQPAYEGQYDELRELLLLAQSAAGEAVELPPYKPDGNETSISRQGILLMIDGELGRLARMKVEAQLHAVRNETFTGEPWREFVSVAVIVRALLAAPNIGAREEVSGDERDPAEAFHG